MSSVCVSPEEYMSSDSSGGSLPTRQKGGTEHLRNFMLILHVGGPRILGSILVLALPELASGSHVSGVWAA